MKQSDTQSDGKAMLPGVRVIDLTDEKGYLCGKILGDMGADVIKIEPPGGDPGRRMGPFYHDIPDTEKSLYWFAYNSNKRGITLDIARQDGRGILEQLLTGADILVESFRPGYLDSIGLGYQRCREINPRLVIVSITPFGQTGPYRDYQGPDIVCMAMSGFMYICGDADRPPVSVPIPQSYLAAAADGAVGAMAACYHRETSGRGQHVDISMQESLLPTLTPAVPFWQLERLQVARYGSSRFVDRGTSRVVWPCRDGYINWYLIGGMTGSRTNKALAAWMEQEGMLPNFMKEIDWDAFDIISVTPEQMARYEEYIGKFFMTHTKNELYRWAIEKRAMLYPVLNSEDLLADEQLQARDFWQMVEHPELNDTILYPGRWALSTEVDLSIRRQAPLIGEHNGEIYIGEMGISGDDLAILKQSGVI